jgi:hypothetical protein
VPSNVALDVVANLVCPEYARTKSFDGRDAPSCASHFLRTSSERSVRLPLTTRVRMPRSWGGASPLFDDPPEPDAYVTTPPLCAPRIIVICTIFSRTSSASFVPAHAVLMRITPKLPHRRRARRPGPEPSPGEGDAAPAPTRNKSVDAASIAVTTAATAAAVPADQRGLTAFADERREGLCLTMRIVIAAMTALATQPACRATSTT